MKEKILPLSRKSEIINSILKEQNHKAVKQQKEIDIKNLSDSKLGKLLDDARVNYNYYGKTDYDKFKFYRKMEKDILLELEYRRKERMKGQSNPKWKRI